MKPNSLDAVEVQWVKAVQAGDVASFEPLIAKHKDKVFATVRRYARRESEIEDLVQEVFLKAFTKIGSYRSEAPFEHWLMRLTVRTCYDALRAHRRNRESNLTDLSSEESDWLDRQGAAAAPELLRSLELEGARQLVERLLENLPPAARLVITLLEIEDRSLLEISALTGWSITLVKVRAFRARKAMKQQLKRLALEQYI